MIKLLQGNCLELMQKIPDKSVNLILCDLPYGITACEWDHVIPFDLLWEQYNRLVTNTGVIALFGTEPFSTKLRMSNLKNYKYDWYWYKNKANGFQHAKNRPLMRVETISVFSNAPMGHASLLGEARMQYNPQGVIRGGVRTVEMYKHGRLLGRRPNQEGKQYQAYENYPDNVLFYDSLFGDRAKHPTQKPVPLLEYLIKTYTKEGDNVLDNCMGSGSTGVACINTHRNFIGMELDQRYFELASKRINQTVPPLF